MLECGDKSCRDLLDAAFGALKSFTAPVGMPAVNLGRVSRGAGRHRWLLESPGKEARPVAGRAQLIYEVDKHLTLALQHARPDLLFLHAAVLELDGSCVALCGSSGAGKSTTAFALLHHGFVYLSDELAPIDVASGLVHPYAHALCLKSVPPPPYRIPSSVLDAGGTLHVPVAALPGRYVSGPSPLAALVFLRSRGSPLSSAPLAPLSAASASARVISSALNALAHPYAGLDVAVTIASRTPAFELVADNLGAAAEELGLLFRR